MKWRAKRIHALLRIENKRVLVLVYCVGVMVYCVGVALLSVGVRLYSVCVALLSVCVTVYCQMRCSFTYKER